MTMTMATHDGIQRQRRWRRQSMTMTTRAMTKAPWDVTRVTIAIATTAKTSAHRRQLCLHINDGNDTASREAAACQEAEAVQRDATQQPAGANKEEGSRMDKCGGCATKGDARQRHATTGNATTSQ